MGFAQQFVSASGYCPHKERCSTRFLARLASLLYRTGSEVWALRRHLGHFRIRCLRRFSTTWIRVITSMEVLPLATALLPFKIVRVDPFQLVEADRSNSYVVIYHQSCESSSVDKNDFGVDYI